MADFFDSVFKTLGNLYTNGSLIYKIVVTGMAIILAHFVLYTVIGIFFTRKFKPAKNFHKYAILIPARNESAVIGNLIDSIHCQDYPAEHITVFVIADNCTDNTAEIARQNGAICYERHNDKEKTKGFALRYLFQRIEEDYGIESFEGYFIFDADNLLNKDYISRMNDSFDSGLKIITSYRNTKNFDENWIASTYAIHWLRSIRLSHRARSVLRLATNIQGTGFLFASELVKDGWRYTSLTEDRAFTADAVAHGYQISYNDAAMFYDEQPTSLKVALRQRIRWSKGHLLALQETGWSLFKNIFTGSKNKSSENKSARERFVEGVRCRWASFDTLAHLLPKELIIFFVWLPVILVIQSCYCYSHGATGEIFAQSVASVPWPLSIISDSLNIGPGYQAMLSAIVISVAATCLTRIGVHFANMFYAIYVFIAERKKIVKMPFRKKVLYTLTWFMFDAIGRWTLYAALFMKVEWKPIPHTNSATIHDIDHSIEHNITNSIVSKKETNDSSCSVTEDTSEK